MDNNTAVCYVNKQGGTRSRILTDEAKEIAAWCDSRNNTIEALYLPGKSNVIADRESRTLCDSSDWKLSARLFNKIMEIWPVGIDLFSNSWNAQLPVFVSWMPQPGAFATDAFSLNWSDHNGFFSPPFSLISRRISKLRREKASGVFVCPIWPSQP